MEKLKILAVSVFVIVIAGVFVSCGSKDRDNVNRYLSRVNDYVYTEEFRTEVFNLIDSAILKKAESEIVFDNALYIQLFNKVLEKKTDEFAKVAGFKNTLEANNEIDRLKENPEIKEQLTRYEERIKQLQTEMEKTGMSKADVMKKESEIVEESE